MTTISSAVGQYENIEGTVERNGQLLNQQFQKYTVTNTLPKYASYFKPTKTETIQQKSVDEEKEKRSKTAQIVKWATAGVCAIASVAAIIATGGAATPLVIGAVSGVSGFVTAHVSDLADQYVEHGNIIEHSDEIDWGGALWKGTLGGIAGFATGYIGGHLSKYMIDTARVSPGIGSLVNSYNPAVRTISGGLAGSVAEVYSGNVSRFAGTYIQTGDFGAAIDEAYNPQNIAFDMFIGGATGAIEAGRAEPIYAEKQEKVEHLEVHESDLNSAQETMKEVETPKALHDTEVEQVKLTEVSEGGKYFILSYEDAESIAFDAIHGPNNADAVVLGKYGDGGPTAYTSVAKDMDAQYFQLDNWDELAARYSDDEIWKINEKFLDIQTSSGREIYLHIIQKTI